MLVALPVLGLALAQPASAALDMTTNLDKTATNAGYAAGGSDLPTTVGRIISVLLGLLGVVFVVLVIYAGFTWMTANGDETKIKKAKSIIIQSTIAIVIIFMAYAITSFVITNLGNVASQ
jgi:cytochrome bd-type quinol oxidase subunit 2